MIPSSAAATAATRRKKGGLKTFIRQTFHWLRMHRRMLGMAAGLCLFSFVRWFHIPSPFAAALLLAFGDKPSPLCLAGLAAGLGFRLGWGIEADLWQYAGCAGLWLLLQKCRPRAGIETAALGGLSMLPRVFAAIAHQDSQAILYALAAVPLCMLCAAALRHGTDAASFTGWVLRGWERFCTLLISLIAIGALGYFWLGEVNVGQLGAVFAALVYAAVNGPAQGVIGGLCCGLALALDGHDGRLVLVLALGGFWGGLPMVKRMRWLSFIGLALANGLGWFVSRAAFAPVGWWTLSAGAIAYCVLPASQLSKLEPWLHGVESGERSMENAFVTQRIRHMQEAIENLARALPVWEEETSGASLLAEKLCAQCPDRAECLGKNRSRTERLLCRIIEGEEGLPTLAQQGCVRAEEAQALVMDERLKRQRRGAAAQKARHEREVTLTHLAALSGTLGHLGELAAGESFHDLRSAHVISLALDELGVPARLSYARRVDGHLQAALEMESLGPMQRSVEPLLRYLAKEEELALAISRTEKGHIELEEIPLYSATIGTASLCAEGDVCGDACCAKRCEGGRLLMMLCDGMGHGESAHRQSEKTLELLLLLLEAGYTRRQAITAVNGIMLGAQAEERYSTVDLADVDLWTGEVFCEKLGACASWVVRGSHMKKVEGASLPLGILQTVTPTACQYRLHSGDILILMSDGVTDAFESEEALRKAILENLYIQPQRMADALLRGALIAGGGVPKDDMSVMVLLLMDRQRMSKAE